MIQDDPELLDVGWETPKFEGRVWCLDSQPWKFLSTWGQLPPMLPALACRLSIYEVILFYKKRKYIKYLSTIYMRVYDHIWNYSFGKFGNILKMVLSWSVPFDTRFEYDYGNWNMWVVGPIMVQETKKWLQALFFKYVFHSLIFPICALWATKILHPLTIPTDYNIYYKLYFNDKWNFADFFVAIKFKIGIDGVGKHGCFSLRFPTNLRDLYS